MKSRFFVLSVSVFMLATILCSCGNNNSDTQSTFSSASQSMAPTDVEFDLDSYKQLVSECRSNINAASIILANVGAYENNYWKALGRFSDDMVDSAFDWLSENSEDTRESVDTAYNNIREAYKNIILTEIEGTEAGEIDKAFRELHDSYSEMYKLVTAPPVSRMDFAKTLSNLIDDFGAADNSLSLFLDEPSD